MFAKINSMGLLGLNAYPVYVEIEASRGLESLDIVGLADVAVKESRERIKSAFRSSGVPFPKARLMVNLAPADVKKSGSVHDLSIAVAILAAQGLVTEKQLDKSAFIGEVSLGGEIRPVSGVLPMTLMAKSQGITEVFVPKGNAFEASVVDGIAVYGVESLSERILHL